MEWRGPVDKPVAVVVRYGSHLQRANLTWVHDLAVLRMTTTFCVNPQRLSHVGAALALANHQAERGRWFLRHPPLRLCCAGEVPSNLLNYEQFIHAWHAFREEVATLGIDLTLRLRARSWAQHVRPRKRRAKDVQI